MPLKIQPSACTKTRKAPSRWIIASLLLLLLNSGCLGERNLFFAITAAATQFAGQMAGATCGDFYLEEISSSIQFSSTSTTLGATSGLNLELSVPNSITTPILATYQVVITVPPEFTFLGFDALGSGASIGSWDFDFFANGQFDNADFSIAHRAIDFDSAYSDSDGSGSFTPVDPTAEYTVGAGGEHIITLTLPDGGIEPFRGNCSYFAFDARYTLLEGLLTLPTAPDIYLIDVEATSVDLDTGNATDNVLPDPLLFTTTGAINVPEPDGALLAGVGLLLFLKCLALSRRQHLLGRRA